MVFLAQFGLGKNFEAREKNFDDQKRGGPRGFIINFSKGGTLTPSPKDWRKKFPPPEFWIHGDVPVCIAKDGGEKLTRRGIIGCEKRKTMSEGSPTIEHF